jgi:AcrR family transcriptional regulator
MNNLLNRSKAVGEAVVREGICTAAIEVLEEKDLKGFSMDAVAAAAGVSKGTLYNYFRNKDELLIAVHDRLFEALIQEVNVMFEDRDRPASKVLREILGKIFQHIGEKRTTSWILDRASYECEALRHYRIGPIQNFLKDLATLIQRGIDAGEFQAQDAGCSAWFIFGLLSFSCEQPMVFPETCPPVERIPESAINFVLQSLTGSRTPSPAS